MKNSILEYDTENREAFTLAEVLITLGIVGVVAVMTIPTVIGKWIDKSRDSRYKKVMASLTNAYKLMLVREQVTFMHQLPVMRCSTTDKGCFIKEHEGIFASDLSSAEELPEEYAILDATEKSPFRWSTVPYIFSTRDGVSYGVMPDDELKSLSVFVDMNGRTAPNVVGDDMIKFRVLDNAKVADVTDELKDTRTCSAIHPELCDTMEKCNSYIASLEYKPSYQYSATDLDGNPYNATKEAAYCDHVNVFAVHRIAGWNNGTCNLPGMAAWYDFYCR